MREKIVLLFEEKDREEFISFSDDIISELNANKIKNEVEDKTFRKDVLRRKITLRNIDILIVPEEENINKINLLYLKKEKNKNFDYWKEKSEKVVFFEYHLQILVEMILKIKEKNKNPLPIK